MPTLETVAGNQVQVVDLATSTVAPIASGGAVPGNLVTWFRDIANVASANYDVVIPFKARVVSITFVKTGGTGGVGDAVDVRNGTTNVIGAVRTSSWETAEVGQSYQSAAALAGVDGIDATYWEIAAGGTLRIAHTNGELGNAACCVIVSAIPVT